MTTAYYSTVLNHPLETVWALIRDFNNYPAYIEGVSESVIEDDKGGDEVGAVRRFCYLGNWIRQRLAGHSDEARLGLREAEPRGLGAVACQCIIEISTVSTPMV